MAKIGYWDLAPELIDYLKGVLKVTTEPYDDTELQDANTELYEDWPEVQKRKKYKDLIGSTDEDDGRYGIVPSPVEDEHKHLLSGDATWIDQKSLFVGKAVGDKNGKPITDYFVDASYNFDTFELTLTRGDATDLVLFLGDLFSEYGTMDMAGSLEIKVKEKYADMPGQLKINRKYGSNDLHGWLEVKPRQDDAYMEGSLEIKLKELYIDMPGTLEIKSKEGHKDMFGQLEVKLKELFKDMPGNLEVKLKLKDADMPGWLEISSKDGIAKMPGSLSIVGKDGHKDMPGQLEIKLRELFADMPGQLSIKTKSKTIDMPGQISIVSKGKSIDMPGTLTIKVKSGSKNMPGTITIKAVVKDEHKDMSGSINIKRPEYSGYKDMNGSLSVKEAFIYTGSDDCIVLSDPYSFQQDGWPWSKTTISPDYYRMTPQSSGLSLYTSKASEVRIPSADSDPSYRWRGMLRPDSNRRLLWEDPTSPPPNKFYLDFLTRMDEMFRYCKMEYIDLKALDCRGEWNTSKIEGSNITGGGGVGGMTQMFEYCTNLRSIDISWFDLSNVSSVSCMFQCCYELESIKLPKYSGGKYKLNAHAMFNQCKKLTSVDLTDFSTANISYMGGMFARCESLTELRGVIDCSSISSVYSDLSGMFTQTTGLSSVTLTNVPYTNENDVKQYRQWLGLTYASTTIYITFRDGKSITL